jgi:hypothetical protein
MCINPAPRQNARRWPHDRHRPQQAPLPRHNRRADARRPSREPKIQPANVFPLALCKYPLLQAAQAGASQAPTQAATGAQRAGAHTAARSRASTEGKNQAMVAGEWGRHGTTDCQGAGLQIIRAYWAIAARGHRRREGKRCVPRHRTQTVEFVGSCGRCIVTNLNGCQR